jgi:DNA-binding NarL/FixJ family response regulator
MAAIPYAVEQIPPTAVTTATGEPAIAVRRPGAPGRSVPGGDVIFLDRRTRNRAPHAEFPAVRVLLADGEKLVRAALRELLEEAGDIAVTGEASSGRDAIALARQMRPDVVLMNVRLPGLDGLEATRRITTDPELTPARVLLVSEDERDEDLFGALRAGAGGFLTMDAEPAELLRAVRCLAGGEVQLSPSVTRRLIDEFASQPDPQRPIPEMFEELTAREREVMALVASGLTNDEIAQQLMVSPATAKTHVSRSMVKLHAHDRAKLVALAYQTGFALPPSERRRAGDAQRQRAGAIAARSEMVRR